MSVVYLKAKNRKSGQMETVAFDGSEIAVGKLKEKVAEKKQVDPREIELSCAQTNKVYADDRTAIPRNSILNFKKVPIKAAPAGAPGGRSMNRAASAPSPPLSLPPPLSPLGSAASPAPHPGAALARQASPPRRPPPPSRCRSRRRPAQASGPSTPPPPPAAWPTQAPSPRSAPAARRRPPRRRRLPRRRRRRKLLLLRRRRARRTR